MTLWMHFHAPFIPCCGTQGKLNAIFGLRSLADRSNLRNAKKVKLAQYLTEDGLTLNEFAKTCGTSASTILRIKDGEVAPSKRVARALWDATGGQVMPNDLYGLHHSALHAGEEKNTKECSADE